MTSVAINIEEKIMDDIIEDANGQLSYESAQRLLLGNRALSSNVTMHLGYKSLYVLNDIELPYNLSLKKGTIGKLGSDDNSIIDIYSWFNRMGFIKNPSTKIIDEVLETVANANTPVTFFDELQDEVSENGRYDANIYKKVMVDWLGAKDESYTYDWLKLLLASIYRNQTFKGKTKHYNPAPYMFVTQSPQGVGKGLFMAGVSGGNNVTYSKSVNDQDLNLYMSQYVLMDMDDLAASGEKNSVDVLKQRVTQKTIRQRKMYTQSIDEKPNRAVWVGSTNRLNIFSDTTGDRRSFPINLGTDRNKENTNIIGQQKYREVYSQDMFLDLWYTWLKDLEDGVVSLEFEYGSEADKKRMAYVQGYTISSDLESTIEDMLNMSVPDSILDADAYDIIDYLSNGDSLKGNRDNVMAMPHITDMKLHELGTIPQSIIHKTIKASIGNVRRQAIVEMMREKGFIEYNRGGRNYRKVNK